jgi:hypothetical protein
MLSKCVRSNVLRVTVQAAHMSAGVPRVLNVIEGGDKGACALRCNFLED